MKTTVTVLLAFLAIALPCFSQTANTRCSVERVEQVNRDAEFRRLQNAVDAQAAEVEQMRIDQDAAVRAQIIAERAREVDAERARQAEADRAERRELQAEQARDEALKKQHQAEFLKKYKQSFARAIARYPALNDYDSEMWVRVREIFDRLDAADDPHFGTVNSPEYVADLAAKQLGIKPVENP